MIKRGKKGITDPVLYAIIGAILISIVFLATTGLVGKLAGLIKKSAPAEEQATIKGFGTLTIKIDEIITLNQEEEKQIVDFFLYNVLDPDKTSIRAYDLTVIQKSFSIIGFDKEIQTIQGFKNIQPSEIKKPTECGTSACLCLYSFDFEESQTEGKSKKIICKIYNPKDNIIFLTGTYPQLLTTPRKDISGNEYSYLHWYWKTSGAITIEKYEDKQNNKIYLYLSQEAQTSTNRAKDASTKITK